MILASERDPATSEAFSENDYRGKLRALQRFCNIILTDCCTGLVYSVMEGPDPSLLAAGYAEVGQA